MYTESENPAMALKPNHSEFMDMKTWMANHRGLFPALYTLCTFAIFGSPVMSGLILANDPSVLYWLGWHGWLVVTVPVLQILAHMAHVAIGRPTFWAMLLSTVLPAMILIVVGYSYESSATDISHRLTSSDCTTFQPKSDLREAYVEAQRVFSNCTEQLAAATQNTQAVATRHIVFQDCPQFSQGPYAEQWAYLAYLEDSQSCSGWCQEGAASIFTASHLVQDPCDQVAGSFLSTRVTYNATRMFVVGLLDLVLSIAALALIQEFMIKADISW